MENDVQQRQIQTGNIAVYDQHLNSYSFTVEPRPHKNNWNICTFSRVIVSKWFLFLNVRYLSFVWNTFKALNIQCKHFRNSLSLASHFCKCAFIGHIFWEYNRHKTSEGLLLDTKESIKLQYKEWLHTGITAPFNSVSDISTNYRYIAIHLTAN